MKLIFLILVLALSAPVTSQAQSTTGASHHTRKKSRAVAAASEETATPKNNGETATVELRPTFTYLFISPSELNNLLSSSAQKFGINDQYKISGGTEFSIAGEYEFNRNFSAGLRMDYFSASSNSVQIKNAAARVTLQSSLSGLPIYLTGTLKYPFPTAPRFAIGTTLGAGIPLFFHANTEISASNIPAVPNGTQSYSATPFTGFISAFTSYEIISMLSARLELGYRFLSSDSMKLTDNYGNIAKAGDLLTDDTGTKVNVNAGSFFIGAGVVISL